MLLFYDGYIVVVSHPDSNPAGEGLTSVNFRVRSIDCNPEYSTWNISWKSFICTGIHIKIVKHLLKFYFKHIFITLAASKRAKHTVLIITPRILIPE